MRKKRSDKLNVSQLFVLNQADSSQSKIFQKSTSNSTNSFSKIVTGLNSDSKDYTNIWPELSSNNSKKKTQNENKLNNVQIPEIINKINNIDIKSGQNDNNFPSLEISKKKGKSKKTLGKPVDQFVKPGDVTDNCTLVKTTHFPGKRKIKRNTPISINIEGAIEVSKARQKKELKRLDPHKPRALTTVTHSGNTLDSTNPVRKKGKVRLEKKKKLTSLRKTIEKLKSLPIQNRDIQGSLCKQHDGIQLTKDDIIKIQEAKIHNSKFREYCKNFASRELVDTVKDFIRTIRCFQDRMFKINEIKARARRRYAVGFHECLKLLKANSFKVIIIATNIERNEALFEKINEFVLESSRQGIPVIFAGTCTDLSYCLLKKNRTCVVGIINYDGANEIYDKMIRLFERDKADYEVKLNEILDTSEPMSTESPENIEEDIRSQIINKLCDKPIIRPSKFQLASK